MHTDKERHRKRKRWQRQTDIETDRQTDIETDRHRDRQTDRQTNPPLSLNTSLSPLTPVSGCKDTDHSTLSRLAGVARQPVLLSWLLLSPSTTTSPGFEPETLVAYEVLENMPSATFSEN